MKKGRHRRYEEARAMKRGPDLDIEAIFSDLESDRPAPVVDPSDDLEAPPVVDPQDLDDVEDDPEDASFSEEEEWERG